MTSLAVAVVVLTALNVSPLMRYHTPRLLLDVNREGNVAVWLSSIMLLLIAAAAFGLAALTTVRGGALGQVRGWRWVAALFVFLSLDEVSSLHESIGIFAARRVWRFEPLAGVYMWVFFLTPLALAVTLVMARFFRRALRAHPHALRWALAGLACWVSVPALELLEPLGRFPRASVLVEETAEWAGELCVLHALLLQFVAVWGNRASAPAPQASPSTVARPDPGLNRGP